ncbi:MAG: TonB-dependent receptor [Desulfobacteraceae bacterium]
MGGRKVSIFKHWLFCYFILCFFAVTPGGTGVVFAQDDTEEFTLEEIVVTGSRIARNNNEALSPIVTIDRDMLDQSATSAIETQLNMLPQFTPTADVPQVAGQDIQPNPTNSPGESTIALRGLGANRTLTLINGRRGTPSNAAGVIDINTIPTAAIQYIDSISGGASSTYGADAMAGVTNFIMRDRFEGFEINMQGGMTQEGDNEEYNISGIMGTNFTDDRGNVMMSFAYNERKAALQRDRSWYRKNWRDPSLTGSAYWPPYTGINLGAGNFPTNDVLNDVMGLPEGEGFGDNGPFRARGQVIFADKDGNAFTGFSNPTQPGIPAAEALGLVDGYQVKLLNNGNLSQNNLDTYLIFPLERWNFYSQGNYKVNDYVGVFGQAYFSKTRSRTTQEPGIIVGNQTVTIYPEYNWDAIPDDIAAILQSRGTTEEDRNAPFALQALLPMNREGLSESVTFNMTTGLEGENIPLLDNWTWEAFVSYGEAENTAEMTGMVSLERLRGVMGGVMSWDYDGSTYSPVFWEGYKNFGQGLTLKGNEEYFNFGGTDATCTSGLNPFDWDSVTQDCWDAVSAPVKSRQTMKQTIYEANTQGHIADLPMGEMRGALGVSYREQDYRFVSDNVNTQGRSWNDKILGLNPVGESEGKIDVTEEYAELLVPVLKDRPFAEQVNINLGGRRSDYNTTGASYTYKAQLDWKTNSFLRFRGGYNRAERAPNIAELYLARTMTFVPMSNNDVCSMRNNQVGWTAHSDNPDWLDVIALCGQKMDATGNPDASYDYYGADWQDIVAYVNANPDTITDAAGDTGDPDVDYANRIFGPDENNDGVPDNGAPILANDFNAMPGAVAGWVRPIDQGNPDLMPETADTWTFGFVLNSFIDDITWLADWRISLDYYNIKVKDAIGLQTPDVVLQMCMSPTYNPTFDPNSPFCAGMERNSDNGGLGNVYRTYYNNGRFSTSGIDFQINWGMQAGPGRVSTSTLINYLIKMDSAELPDSPMTDYVGTFGPTGNGLNGNSFEWRMLTTVTYAMDNWDVSLRWQHLDELKNITGTNTSLAAYDMFDLLGNYRLADNYHIRFGIQNLFNTAPKLYNRDYSNPNNMYNGNFSTQLHDVNGRRFYLGLRVFF